MKNERFTNKDGLLPRHRRTPRTPARCTSGSQMCAAFAHSQETDKRNDSFALPMRSVVEKKEQEKMKNHFSQTFRTAGAAVQRDWRTLVHVRQHGFSPAYIGCAVGSRSKAHTLRVTGICPVLRSPRTQGAAVFAAPAATNANQKSNRGRGSGSLLPFPLPAEKRAFMAEIG